MDACKRDFIVAGGCGYGVLRTREESDVSGSDDGAAGGIDCDFGFRANLQKQYDRIRKRADK